MTKNTLNVIQVRKLQDVAESLWETVETDRPTWATFADWLAGHPEIGFPVTIANARSAVRALERTWPGRKPDAPTDADAVATLVNAVQGLIRQIEAVGLRTQVLEDYRTGLQPILDSRRDRLLSHSRQLSVMFDHPHRLVELEDVVRVIYKQVFRNIESIDMVGSHYLELAKDDPDDPADWESILNRDFTNAEARVAEMLARREPAVEAPTHAATAEMLADLGHPAGTPVGDDGGDLLPTTAGHAASSTPAAGAS